jgi:hypothetical protein
MDRPMTWKRIGYIGFVLSQMFLVGILMYAIIWMIRIGVRS